MSELKLFYGLMYGLLGLSGVVFLLLLFVVAPYGRHNRGGWGPQIGDRLAWIFMEGASLASFVAVWAMGSKHGGVAIFFLGLWAVHYGNRTFLDPIRRRGGGRKMPALVMLMGVTFNLANGYLNARWVSHFGPAYTTAWLGDPRFLAGVALFGAGFVINQHADHVLAHLREPGETGYKIPRGGMYRFVSCPNYLGELMEWTGWAVATWSLPGVAFAVWTAANLVPRALANHRWYRETFADYPAERRAVIPFLL